VRLDTGKKLFVRSLITVAAEEIPFFWPMRNFIHHNPLYGLEEIDFREAVERGRKLFHAETFLKREHYIELFRKGEVGEEQLRSSLRKFLRGREIEGVDTEELFFRLMTEGDGLRLYSNAYINCCCPEAEKLSGKIKTGTTMEETANRIASKIGSELTLYEVVDSLFGSRIGAKLNELIIKVCEEFLDEGQAVWGMPNREKGLYRSWREIAIRNKRYTLKGCCGVEDVIKECEEPEEAVVFILKALGIPEDIWEKYITLELSKLHGWTGFIRWRANAKEYYWQQKYPADPTDYMAVRLLLSMSLLRQEERRLPVGVTLPELKEFILNNPGEAVLRYEFFMGLCPPTLAEEIGDALDTGRVEPILERYRAERERVNRLNLASYLLKVWELAGYKREELLLMEGNRLTELQNLLAEFEKEEGYLWLRAHELTLMDRLLSGINRGSNKKSRPLAQALFCIDVRSERFRRNLEAIGDYETFGIAGFFGIPLSFIELGKGHEAYLCPVLIKPKNVVLELRRELEEDKESLGKVVKEILHDLKHNVLTPYITVEAIGLLFGFDMIGKTLFPLGYGMFRERLSESKPPSKLMIDKPSKEYVLEVIGILQREIVSRALKEELKITTPRQEVVEHLRKVALEEEELSGELISELGIDTERIEGFIDTLRHIYRVERGFTRIQIEQLAKIGFTLEEQVFFVEKALKSIGLTDNFGKLVLVIGHGSKSDNNPYESALDCGACGGDHGAVNAKVFAKIANKREVREKLKTRGIDIPDDTYFVAGEHNTTTDEVEFFDLEEVPATHTPFLKKIKEDIELAGKRTALERCKELGESCRNEERAFKVVKRNSTDWTQVRPEWGLSGNYAFVVGSRSLTKELNLEGKVFLHSYDWRKDPKGLLLETILSGPLVVGEWINMEHYFSTVDNDSFGSGSKVYHNVVGRFGVMAGNFSDLRTGLPAQTVLKGDRPFHRPVRLITIVEAPLSVVKLALKGVRKVRELVHNRWINMIVLDPTDGIFYLYDEGEWKAVKRVEEVQI